MNYTVHIQEPGLYQLVNGDLVSVQSVDYTNQNWISVTAPCYVTIINGEISNVSYTGTCVHEWRMYHGLIESYDICTKCNIARKEEPEAQRGETD